MALINDTKGARALFAELELDRFELEEAQKPTITQTEYLTDYTEKKKNFYKLSVASHEHNTFTEDHMSTLTDTGYYKLGHAIRRITSTFDKDFTLVEVGAGTGIGAGYMLSGLFGEPYPSPYIHFKITDLEKKAKINRYIYTDPFNDLMDVPTKYKSKISIQHKKCDLLSAIHGIHTDDTIKNAILLVVCPPPIHDDRRCRFGKGYADTLVSTDVMALVESVKCSKIRHVMIVRYNDCGRSDLDGTYDFHTFHVPMLKKFNKWNMSDNLITVDTYGNGYDYYSRYLHLFTRCE
jgi:hypothetical protein